MTRKSLSSMQRLQQKSNYKQRPYHRIDAEDIRKYHEAFLRKRLVMFVHWAIEFERRQLIAQMQRLYQPVTKSESHFYGR